MEYRTLEINVLSAKDLNKVNLITKMDVYVIVYISGAGGDDKSKQETRTHVDKNGDSNPRWDFPMKFTMDEATAQQNQVQLTLVFKLRCKRFLGDKDIGEVHVPIKELIDQSVEAFHGEKQHQEELIDQSAEALHGEKQHHHQQQQQQFVSHQVRKPNGQPKGQISFSYMFAKAEGAVTADHAASSSPFSPRRVGYRYPPPSPTPPHVRYSKARPAGYGFSAMPYTYQPVQQPSVDDNLGLHLGLMYGYSPAQRRSMEDKLGLRLGLGIGYSYSSPGLGTGRCTYSSPAPG